MRKLLSSKWPAIGWTILIFVLLTVGTGNLEKVPMLGVPHLDKVVHFILFGTLVFLWWSFLYEKQKFFSLSMLLTIFLAVTAYGIGMEFYQKYFTSREFELGDIYADAAGAAMASFICSYIKN